jgi:hypothetical protein
VSPMSPSDAVDLTKVYIPTWRSNRERIDWVDRWYRGRLDEADKPNMPKRSTAEYKELRDRSVTPWLRFVVRSLSQGLYVEGYRRSDDPRNADGWHTWQRNGLDARQTAVYRGAMAHSLAYVTIMPGDPVPVIRGVSARKMIAMYQDVAEDDWPMHALRGEEINGSDGKKHWRWKLYDAEAIYTIDSRLDDDSTLTFVTHETHDAGECPVVRFSNDLDLDGRSDGEVEPFIDLAARIDQDTFDRLVVQRFGAWLVRYIAGMSEPDTDAEARATKIRLSIEDILVAADPDTKFGTLPATPLDGFIKAHDSDIRDLAVVTQTPPQELLGEMINMSAEALAAAEAGRSRKLDERKKGFGESWEQTFRMEAHLRGDDAGASDFGAQTRWRDMESRSLAQTADAFGKLATMLGFPQELLWEKIPGLSMQDVEAAKAIVEKRGGMDKLLEHLNNATASAASVAAPPAA